MSVRFLDLDKSGKEKWQIDYYPNGRKGKRERQTYVGDKQSAHRYETQLRRQSSKLHVSTANPRIRDIIPEFLQVSIHQQPS